ncbi:MAG: M6 family metalloprotease domain-containing protein [Bacteroidota bacterium]
MKNIVILFVIIICFTFKNSFSQISLPKKLFISSLAPACPDTMLFVQQDDRPINYLMKGDGSLHKTYSLDGYTLLYNNNRFEYAIHDISGDLVSSGKMAVNEEFRTESDNVFLSSIPSMLRYSQKQIDESKLFIQAKQNKSLKSFPTQGQNKTLFILIDFPDKPAIKTKQQFEELGNLYNYNNTGSVNQYYLENSFGQFNIQIDVYGWYTASQPWAYYGNNDNGNDANARELATEALAAAEQAGVDFSQYDNDGDGEVDGIQFIHAGGGEEAGAGADAIWSHSWYLNNINYDNVNLSAYTMNPELYGNSTSITSIGVICHEFGHNLGLPDFYDTDYTSDGLGNWDMMAGGSWNFSGIIPANHNAWSKYFLGWQTPTVIDSPNTYTLSNAEENNVSYLVNTGTSNEYFLLENRQNLKFDSYLPGHGLLIFHVDGNYIDNTINSNTVNNEDAHQGLDLEEADANPSSNSYSSDPFPGNSNFNRFTDGSTPGALAWNSIGTVKPITNTTENNTDKTITFLFMGAGINTPLADFTASTTAIYPTQNINFTDLSYNNPTSWKWYFDGGNPSTSTLQNPSNIVYNNAGTFKVKLVVNNSFGSDSLDKTTYIKVSSNYNMSSATINTCKGYFYDPGGVMDNYPTSKVVNMTFIPGSPDSVLQFNFFNFNLESSTDCSQDFLEVYNGSTLSSPKIGKYCGTSGPGIVTSTSSDGALTFRFRSDGANTSTGWKSAFKCVSPTGINNNTSNSRIALFPNPSNNNITIDVKDNQNLFNISIYDVNGKLVKTTNSVRLPFTFDIFSLDNGIYHVSAISEKDNFNKKFIKL